MGYSFTVEMELYNVQTIIRLGEPPMFTDLLSVIRRCLVKVTGVALVAMLVMGIVMTGVTTAYAASLVFTVNSTDDVDDGTCDSAHFIDAGHEAIIYNSSSHGSLDAAPQGAAFV
jgi:hypothetical protein